MLSIFWDSRGVILTDYLPKGETLNSDYYCNLLEKLHDALKKKKTLWHDQKRHPSPGRQCTCPYGPSIRCHRHRLGYELLQYPPYSPDLAPTNFFLFPEMKKPLRSRRFDDREDVIFELEQWFLSKAEDFYKEGLKQVNKCWLKCVTLQGDYMEKN
ncbi:hypothetical protein JRQ81_016739 [Phrynocephalus forsythii]|uniref:Transposase n=1 Tax=Phrynocephalus forsythii TaxID=171643 RepID=A0A9Q0XST6_9SAUR|nr:hypothetical protein JRQ81_016739 [Phrynocephalus forsythii]